MKKFAGIDLSRAPTALGVLAFRGPDAAKFLQGQLSAEVEKLLPGQSVLAGLHNAQGRAIALLALVRTKADEILAVVPVELLSTIAAGLRKFIFRAKLNIEDASAEYRVFGSAADPDGVARIAWGGRALLLVPRDAPQLEIEPAGDSQPAAWELADVRAGLPQVFAATSESFVAQMLNLDLLGAIAFDKGCYTGQEVIARAHYRGRVKRRMQRWSNAGGKTLQPGDSARGPDGRALRVVRVANTGDGQEVLAVGLFGPAGDAEASTPADAVTLSGPLPLPYALPG